MENHLCEVCQEILGERPKAELLCHHFFHMECLLTNFTNQCKTCHAQVFPEEAQAEEEIEDDADTETILSQITNTSVHERALQLYNNNRIFRRDLKTYAHACSAVSRPRNEFYKLIREKKAELAQPYALIKAQVEGLYNTKKDEILQSEIYKTYNIAQSRSLRLYTNLIRKYNLERASFQPLRQFQGLRRLRPPPRWRWYYRPNRVIYRSLRLPLRY